MLIKNSWGQMCEPGALLGRWEWKHIQTSARRHAREDGERHSVIGIRQDDGTHNYVIAASSSGLVARHELNRERRLLRELAERESREQ